MSILAGPVGVIADGRTVAVIPKRKAWTRREAASEPKRPRAQPAVAIFSARAEHKTRDVAALCSQRYPYGDLLRTLCC